MTKYDRNRTNKLPKPQANGSPYTYLYHSSNPKRLDDLTAATGCVFDQDNVFPQIGYSFCTSDTLLDGVTDLTLTPMVANLPTEHDDAFDLEEDGRRRLDDLATDELLGQLEWYLDAVGARGAWSQGITGAGVTVAVLDGGLVYNHPDMSTVNPALTMDFTGEGPGIGPRQFSHATHVAGIIGATDSKY